jgi:hypothetical protein
MVNLTGPGDSQSEGAAGPREPDDRSDNAHRQLIGYIGLALPLILWVIAGWRPTGLSARWRPMDSISAYYYSGAVAAFVGLLVALALFLITYRGFDNKYGWVDRLAARIAGFAALLVAFFPTSAPDGFPKLPWWTPSNRVVHYISAIVLFSMFALFCLWLFRLTTSDPPPPDKRRRNGIYVGCGIVILISMTWAGVAGWKEGPIFWPESLALIAFAISWLVKGRAPRTIANAVRDTLS